VTGELWPLDPAAYARHALHRTDLAWPESNCYVDLWIELLHTWGAEPLAALPFTLAVDLEGDQWTFFKFPLADLYTLYGVEVFELNVWDRLVAHLEEQLALGRPSLVEVDAFHLPDTVGTSYHVEHVKTSIGIQALDAGERRLGYFHNAGYYELEGRDFASVFRLEDHQTHPEDLPPYVEVAKFRARPRLANHELLVASLDLLAAHVARLPRDNPFRRYASRFPADLERLAGQPLAQFHRYAFATLRQCGAAFELAAAYLRWIHANGEHGLDQIAGACDVIATTAKTLQFKTARFVNTRRPFDAAPLIDTMAAAWDETVTGLTERYGTTTQRV
jgi:Domain of unknown function (DUF1839)